MKEELIKFRIIMLTFKCISLNGKSLKQKAFTQHGLLAHDCDDITRSKMFQNGQWPRIQLTCFNQNFDVTKYKTTEHNYGRTNLEWPIPLSLR